MLNYSRISDLYLSNYKDFTEGNSFLFLFYFIFHFNDDEKCRQLYSFATVSLQKLQEQDGTKLLTGFKSDD